MWKLMVKEVQTMPEPINPKYHKKLNKLAPAITILGHTLEIGPIYSPNKLPPRIERMTTFELITELQKFPNNAIVFVTDQHGWIGSIQSIISNGSMEDGALAVSINHNTI